MSESKKILIAPLDWGIGHAARCIPIIRKHIAMGDEVVLASNGRSKALLQSHFPNQKFLPDPPDYRIHYSKQLPFLLKVTAQLPRILNTISKENIWLKDQLEKAHFDLVISDNRYGLFSKLTQTVLITHQTAPIVPAIGRSLVFKYIRLWCERFDETWIPDVEETERSFGGQLSHSNLPSNARYIGLLSRFNSVANPSIDETFQHLAVISGPEPTRSQFESMLFNFFQEKNETALIVSGKPEMHEDKVIGKVRVVSSISDNDLMAYAAGAKYIYARSGYSSIMDFAALNVLDKVNWYPTKGQTEQVYLASSLKR
jgi:hypothetical protein